MYVVVEGVIERNDNVDETGRTREREKRLKNRFKKKTQTSALDSGTRISARGGTRTTVMVVVVVVAMYRVARAPYYPPLGAAKGPKSRHHRRL